MDVTVKDEQRVEAPGFFNCVPGASASLFLTLEDIGVDFGRGGMRMADPEDWWPSR